MMKFLKLLLCFLAQLQAVLVNPYPRCMLEPRFIVRSPIICAVRQGLSLDDPDISFIPFPFLALFCAEVYSERQETFLREAGK